MLGDFENVIAQLPEFLQPFFPAFLLIIIGYLLSKVVAALFGSATNILTRGNKLASDRAVKFVFWLLWLGFIVVGLRYLPLVKSNLDIWHPDEISLVSIWPVFAVAIGLLVLVQRNFTVPSKITKLCAFLKRGLSPKREFVPRLICTFLFLYAAVSLQFPEKPVFWPGAFLAMMVFAALISKVSKEIIRCFWDDTEIIRLANSLIFATFIVGTIRAF